MISRGLPLPTLLSHVLIAFTIEFDNEFERQMPHRTSRHGATDRAREGPWLASMAMWSNCMRFISENGVRVRELEELARTKTNLNGMQRWGYVTVAPAPADTRPKPPQSDWVIRATARGRKAKEVWRPLFGAIEKRWPERFGKDQIERLRHSLWAVISRMDLDLPDCLPILGYGLYSRGPSNPRRPMTTVANSDGSGLTLPGLLSRVLLAFAIEYENESELSLAIGANVLRVLDKNGVRLRDLPILSGVSKEAISMALGVLQKAGMAVVEGDNARAHGKVIRLTGKGREAREAHRKLLASVEKRWRTRFGEHVIRELRESLEPLVGDATAESSPLFGGLVPYPDGWRASVPRRGTLPHYPMVLHRGGYPDGS